MGDDILKRGLNCDKKTAKNKKDTKDINTWAKNLKHNEKIANKYKGVKTVEDILKVAREDGYNFTEKELLDFNLDLVAGGGGAAERAREKAMASSAALQGNSNTGSGNSANANLTIGQTKTLTQSQDVSATLGDNSYNNQISIGHEGKQEARI